MSRPAFRVISFYEDFVPPTALAFYPKKPMPRIGVDLHPIYYSPGEGSMPETGSGSYFPATPDNSTLFFQGWRGKSLKITADLTFTPDGEPPISVAFDAGLTASNAGNDLNNAFGATIFQVEGENYQAVLGDFWQKDEQIYCYFFLSINVPDRTLGVLSLSVTGDTEGADTYASSVSCETIIGSIPIFRTDEFATVTGTITIEIPDELGYREYTDEDGTPIYDEDTGAQLITPLPRNLVL